MRVLQRPDGTVHARIATRAGAPAARRMDMAVSPLHMEVKKNRNLTSNDGEATVLSILKTDET